MSAFPHAAGWYPRFRSKIDVWLGGVLLLGILVSSAGAIGLLRQKGIASLAIIPLLASGLALRVLIETWYGITDTDLVVHCGPFRTIVPISSIRAIAPARSVVSAPALSLDRLEVTHASGTLVISPADKAGFIQALRQRHPTVKVAPIEVPLGVSSQERLLKWSVPVVTTVVLTMRSVLNRVLTVVTILLMCSALIARQEPRRTELSVALGDVVNGERQAAHLPGLAAVIVRSDVPPLVYVSGERRIGKGDMLAPADRMHLGSLTKGITATVIGALVEKRLMTFDTTIGQTFSELSAQMQPGYHNVSVRQLLAHSGGIPPYRTRESLQWMLALSGTPIEQRYAFVQRILTETPRFEPGTRHEYSNAGAAIAGVIAERVGGAAYRELAQQLVFGPLGAVAAFGNPGRAADSQPWGHTRTFFGSLMEVAPADPVYTTPLAIEPAGDASPSIQDYGRFLQLHLRGLRGRDDVLKATTIQELHRRVAPTNPALAFAMGWSVMPRDGIQSHEHVGSYGAYVAYATIQPSRDVAVAAFTNLGGGQDLRDTIAKLALRLASRVTEQEK
jgi:D-alanyl-D-alanine carboxypeptidase